MRTDGIPSVGTGTLRREGGRVPEGDTIHKLAAQLRPDLVGRMLIRGPQGLRGQEVTRVEARGKHLLIHAGDRVLRTHLGMRGTWHRYRPGEPWKRRYAPLVLATEETVLVCFDPSQVEVFPARELPVHPLLRNLGPDLADPRVDLDEVLRRIRPGPELGEVLLDQGVACGLGNVYKSEVPFLGPLEVDPFRPGRGVDPFRPVESFHAEELKGLYRRAAELLRANLGGWPRTTTADRRHAGPRGSALWVYRRAGRPCRVCGTRIACRLQGEHARPTWFCPRCQGSGSPRED